MRKNKTIASLLAALIFTAAFFTPMTAYALDIDEPIQTEAISETDETDIDVSNLDDVDIESLDYEELMALLEFFNMFATTDDVDGETPAPTEESAIPDDSKAFTPDGQASVVDLAYEGDGKMFYTFKTPAGNVFYLIIDRQRGTDNVYFLNAVTEYDLLALAENAGVNNVNESAIPNTNPSTTNPNGNGGTGDNPDDPNAEADTPPPKKSNNSMLIFLLIGVAVVGVAAYYIKVIRPKQQANIDDEDDDIPDEDDGEEMQFEDEPDDTDSDEYEDFDDNDDGDNE